MSVFRALRRLAAAFLAAMPIAVLAGGPLSICGPATQPSASNVALKYPGAGSITLNYDQGTLGPLTKAQADALVTSAVSLWTSVSTATVMITRGPDLGSDATAANYGTYYNQFADALNPVIYDTDGTIIDTELGIGASNSVLGFAGSAWFGYPTCQYAEGQAVLSGKLLTSGVISQAQMSNVITHEIGHLIGLDHTQLDSSQGLASSNFPMMYPIAFRTTNTLHEDDATAVSALYPDTPFASSYGTLSGTFATAGATPLLGANIWAQGAAGTFSIVSDYLMKGTGAFDLHLPPGTYTLHAEAIDTGFTGGSGVGPYSNDLTDLSFQPPLYSGVNGTGTPIAVTLGGGTPTQITITAGCSASVPFRIDGTGTLTGNCNVPPPAAPTLIAPSGSITTATPTYTWNASSGATSYTLLVQNTGGVAINNTYSAAALGCAAGGTCTVTPATALTNGSSYNWFVNASNSGGTSAWSTGNSITVNTAVVPAAPTLVSPTGTITTTTPTFTWNASTGATSYRLLVQNTAGAPINTVYTASAAGCGAGTGTCAIAATTALANGATYNWFVNASNSAGTSAWSAAKTITVNTATTPGAPTLVSPSGTITTTTPTYTWNASAGATSYYLLVQNTAGVAVGVSFSASAVGCGAGTGTCSVTPSTALTNGSTYNWFVNASNSAGTSAWSAANGITVNSATAPAPPAVPVTISPSGTVTTTTPTYTWNASAGATSYYLLVQNTAGVAVSASFSASAVGCAAGTGTCSVTPSTPLANGASYNWFVNATNSVGTSAWSAARGISVSAAGPSVPLAPVPMSPSGTVTTATPTYTWNASAGATSYYLLVQNTAGVAVSVSFTATAAGCGAGTGTCSMTPAAALANGATYNWFVNASNSLGTSPWSAATTITVSAAGPSVPLAPTQIAPSGSTGTRTPTYSWNASAGATSYYLLVQNTAGVAIGTSLSATSLGCGSGTGTCSVTPATSLAAATTYVWFVNASDSLGTSAWSSGKTITTP